MLSMGRLVAIAAFAFAVVAAVNGGLAVARHGRRRTISALVLGAIAVVIGGAVVATAPGGLGTGHGFGGGVVAVVVGVVGMALGGLALRRARIGRDGSSSR